MEFYEVNFKTLVSPARGELIIPFREVIVRKLQRTSGDFKAVGEITCRRLREYVVTALGTAVVFAQLGAVDRARKTLSVDALITFVFILLEINDTNFLHNDSIEEFVIDQSFLNLATSSNIRLAQFEEFDYFTIQRVEEEVVPVTITTHYNHLDNPVFFRVW